MTQDQAVLGKYCKVHFKKSYEYIYLTEYYAVIMNVLSEKL